MKFKKILEGMRLGLEAVWSRSSSAMLPGLIGTPREKAVEDFLIEWLPKKYGVSTNSYTLLKNRVSQEIDVLVYNQDEGIAWPLVKEGLSKAIHHNYAKGIIEVKSTLNKKTWENLEKKIIKYDKFLDGENSLPFILFVYKLDPKWDMEFLTQLTYPSCNIDAIFILNRSAHLMKTSQNIELISSIKNGLTLSQAKNDANTQNEVIQDFSSDSRAHSKYITVDHDENSDFLLILACYITSILNPDDEELTNTLIGWFGNKEKYTPIFE